MQITVTLECLTVMLFTVYCYHILYGLIFLWFCVRVSFFHYKNSTDGCWRGEVNWRMVWTKYSCSSTKVSEIIPVSFRTYSPGAAKTRPRQSFEGCISHCPTVRNVLAIYLQVQHGMSCWSSVCRYGVGNGWPLNFNKGRAWGKETAGKSPAMPSACPHQSHHRCVFLSAEWHSSGMSRVPPCRSEWWCETSERSHLGWGGNWATIRPFLSSSSASKAAV